MNARNTPEIKDRKGFQQNGIDRFYNGKASRAERGLKISMIAVVDVEQAIGYSLSVQQTPAPLIDGETVIYFWALPLGVV